MAASKAGNRGPGRPRKAEGQLSQSQTKRAPGRPNKRAQEDGAEPPTKRGRGRPRKDANNHSNEPANNDNALPKRGRGRPRKEAVPIVISSDESSSDEDSGSEADHQPARLGSVELHIVRGDKEVSPDHWVSDLDQWDPDNDEEIHNRLSQYYDTKTRPT
ncbi:hypothetical protein Hte_005879 [Hypoxylon texense]